MGLRLVEILGVNGVLSERGVVAFGLRFHEVVAQSSSLPTSTGQIDILARAGGRSVSLSLSKRVLHVLRSVVLELS